MPLAVENPFIFCYTARIDCYLAISPLVNECNALWHPKEFVR